MGHRVEGFSYGYLCIQLFFQFPYQAGFGRFTWFDLPSGEFPFASQLGSLLPTESQNFLPVLQDSAGYQERFSIHREVMIGSLSEKSKEPGCTPELPPACSERQGGRRRCAYTVGAGAFVSNLTKGEQSLIINVKIFTVKSRPFKECVNR